MAKELAALISEYYRLVRRRELANATSIELSTWDQADKLLGGTMSYSNEELRARMNPSDPAYPHLPSRRRSDPEDLEPECDGPICVACDDPGPVRCAECGESFCPQCFDKHWVNEHEAEAA